MQLKRVKTEDVYPSEGNPRRDFGDLDGRGHGLQPRGDGDVRLHGAAGLAAGQMQLVAEAKEWLEAVRENENKNENEEEK